ncbi:MAG: HlyC/CorC family transporter [Spartobacteria bacterium]|nr:HlyC/CorC family transporter [Spartobacteria bacterium]
MLFIDIFVIFILLFCSAFFSSAEVTFFSLNPLDIRRIRSRRKRCGTHIEQILAQPNRLLSSILIGNTLVNISASMVTFALVSTYLHSHAEPVSVALITVLLLIFGEIGPKRLAVMHTETMAIMYTPVIRLIIRLLTPLRFILEYSTQHLHHHLDTEAPSITQAEFGTLIDLSEQNGIIDPDEGDMLHKILMMEDLKASDLMIPRMDIIGFDQCLSQEDRESIILSARVAHVVVYDGSIDNIIGVLDVFAYMIDPQHNLPAAMRPPYYIPECIRLGQQLHDFQKGKQQFAIVVDEYGGTSGIVTRGIILEAVVGESTDANSDELPTIQELEKDHWLVDAEINLEELNNELGLHLAEEGIDRLSGWITAIREFIPSPGDVVVGQGIRATVREMNDKRMIRVEIQKINPELNDGDAL